MKFSLVIPCYNESKNIPILFEKCWRYLQNEEIEIIFVDNGSKDNTENIINKLINKYPKFRFIKITKNIGYGHGIMSGIRQSKGEIVGWTHADLETDPKDVIKIINFYKKNGTQYYVKGKRKGRSNILTFGMSIISSVFLRKFLWDINAQPTMFPKTFLSALKDPPNEFTLDLYTFYIAKKIKMKIHRIDVKFGTRMFGVSSWKKNFRTKFKVIKNTIIYIISLSLK